jgi:hypothetical protein
MEMSRLGWLIGLVVCAMRAHFLCLLYLLLGTSCKIVASSRLVQCHGSVLMFPEDPSKDCACVPSMATHLPVSPQCILARSEFMR